MEEEMRCLYCKKILGPEPHTIGGPDCAPISREEKKPAEEKGEQEKKYDEKDLVRQGLPGRKTLD